MWQSIILDSLELLHIFICGYSFLQSDMLLVGPDYLVKAAGIMKFSKIFQNSQSNWKNDFKELRKFSEDF